MLLNIFELWKHTTANTLVICSVNLKILTSFSGIYRLPILKPICLFLFQTKYFGLYYLNKQTKLRWVELDKSLKKQIDKNSQELTLYFGVMYYVANIDSLEQEITR